MSKHAHPLATLRQTIRQAGKQYRYSDDNSQSLFHPDQGFTYAYDISLVEKALEEFEKQVTSINYQPGSGHRIEQELIKEAQQLVATSTDVAVRDFARSVAAYLIINKLPDSEESEDRVVSITVNQLDKPSE